MIAATGGRASHPRECAHVSNMRDDWSVLGG